MEKKNYDFIGKVKEFFRPTKSKIVTFVIIVLVTFIDLAFIGKLSCFGGSCPPSDLEVFIRVILLPVSSKLFYFLPVGSAPFLWILEFVYLYTIASIVCWTFGKLKQK